VQDIAVGATQSFKCKEKSLFLTTVSKLVIIKWSTVPNLFHLFDLHHMAVIYTSLLIPFTHIT